MRDIFEVSLSSFANETYIDNSLKYLYSVRYILYNIDNYAVT